MRRLCASLAVNGKEAQRKQMVRAVGLEPTILAEPDFESGASTNFTTPADVHRYSACAARRNMVQGAKTDASISA